MSSIHEIAKSIYQNAVEHGWYEKERSFPEVVALIHSEASEALEEYRDGHPVSEVYYVEGKPEGVPIELADVVIRVFDFCVSQGIDIEYAIEKKHEFNKSRPYRHGGKVC